MISKEPLLFEPYLKSVIWGGNKITRYKNLPPADEKIGESWEISAVPGHESVVACGQYKGMKLNELVDKFGVSLLGTKVEEKFGKSFPLLIKFIDAADNLSVQVHPDDDLASRRHDSLGKTEMWYIVESEPEGCIFAGFNKDITQEDYDKAVASNTLGNLLKKHDSQPGDILFIPAGLVHAIGAGNLLAEIQESSDITYRIYDYDRRDSEGNPRQLHTAEARDAIDFAANRDVEKTVATSDDEEIVRCNHFVTRRVLLDGEKKFDYTPSSFTIVMCVEGSVNISYADGATQLPAGHSALLPAVLTDFDITGKGTFLLTRIE